MYKKEVSNAKRLASLKQRYQEKNSQLKQISASLKNIDGSSHQSKRIKFDVDVEEDLSASNNINIECNKKKLTLFDSDDEEKDDNERFQIKPQFEGFKGQQLLERSASIFDERFKLDERFKDSDEGSAAEQSEENDKEKDEEELIDEKGRDLDILEQVLGFQVQRRKPELEAKRKRHLRFDPESKTASDLLRKPKMVEVKPEMKKRKKNKPVKEAEPQPEVSKERYFKISSDLKEVFNSSSTPFSFSQMFPTSEDVSMQNNYENAANIEEASTKDTSVPDNKETTKTSKNISAAFSTGEKKKFFMNVDDPRLKEGVEFFKRQKSLDEVREDWMKTRPIIVDMHKTIKKKAIRNLKTKRSVNKKTMYSSQKKFQRR